jgi:hypothetical protein
MDRHRFSKRSRELTELARLVEGFARMPDGATEKDFRQAAALIRGASNDIDELVRTSPPGCICRSVRDENNEFLDYTEACLHHRQLYTLRESLKADYAKMERALKSEVRLKLVAAALSGTAGLHQVRDQPSDVDDFNEDLAKRAIEIADATIRQITKET